MAVDVAGILPLLERYGYLIVFLAGLGEALPLLGFLIPGQAVILVAGAVAASGHLNLWLVMLAALPAGIIGDAFTYYLGRTYGRQLLEKHGPRLAITDKHLERSNALFHKYGVFALVLARFSFLTRGIGPLLAGMSHMRQMVFWPINVLGAILWAGGYALLGYFFGAAYFRVESVLGRILTWTLVSVVGLYLLYRVLERYAEQFTRDDLYVALMGIAGGTVFGVLADRIDKLGHANRVDQFQPTLMAWLEPIGGALALLEPLGSYSFVGIVSLALLAWLAHRRRTWEAALVGIAVGGVLLLTETVRQILRGVLEPEVVGGTFPGANASVSIVLAGVVAYLVGSHSKRRWTMPLTLLAGCILAVATGLAPVAAAQEQPTDFLGGLALGVAWLSVSILLVEFALKRGPATRED